MSEMPKYLMQAVERTIATDQGSRVVQAHVCPWIDGLAVTHHPFGSFSVTHERTGRKVAGPYERYGSALLRLLELGTLFNWDLDAAALTAERDACAAVPVRFGGATVTSTDGTRPMTVKEYLAGIRTESAVFRAAEFPWESPDKSPMALAWVTAVNCYPEIRDAFPVHTADVDEMESDDDEAVATSGSEEGKI